MLRAYIILSFYSYGGLYVSFLICFGQALALQGPTGSMIRAIMIMQKYKDHVLWVFSLTLLTVGLSAICGFYYVFSWYGAHICTVVGLIGMFMWQRICLQIYNEMKFVRENDYGAESESNPLDIYSHGNSTSERTFRVDEDQRDDSNDIYGNDTIPAAPQTSMPAAGSTKLQSPVLSSIKSVFGYNNHKQTRINQPRGSDNNGISDMVTTNSSKSSNTNTNTSRPLFYKGSSTGTNNTLSVPLNKSTDGVFSDAV